MSDHSAAQFDLAQSLTQRLLQTPLVVSGLPAFGLRSLQFAQRLFQPITPIVGSWQPPEQPLTLINRVQRRPSALHSFWPRSPAAAQSNVRPQTLAMLQQQPRAQTAGSPNLQRFTFTQPEPVHMEQAAFFVDHPAAAGEALLHQRSLLLTQHHSGGAAGGAAIRPVYSLQRQSLHDPSITAPLVAAIPSIVQRAPALLHRPPAARNHTTIAHEQHAMLVAPDFSIVNHAVDQPEQAQRMLRAQQPDSSTAPLQSLPVLHSLLQRYRFAVPAGSSALRQFTNTALSEQPVREVWSIQSGSSEYQHMSRMASAHQRSVLFQRSSQSKAPYPGHSLLNNPGLLQRIFFVPTAVPNQPALRQRHSLEQPMLSFVHRAPDVTGSGAVQRSSWGNRTASAAPDQRVDPVRPTLHNAALLASSPAAPLPLLQRNSLWSPAAGVADQYVQLQRRRSEAAAANQPTLHNAALLASSPAAPLPLLQRNSLWSPTALDTPDQYVQLQRRRGEQPAPLATDSTIQPHGRLSQMVLARETALFSPTALRRAQDDLPTPHDMFGPIQAYRNETTALPLPAQLFLLQPAMLQRTPFAATPSNQPVLRQRHSLEQPMLSFGHRTPDVTGLGAVQRSSWGNRTASAASDQRVDPMRSTLRSAAILASSPAAPLPLLQRNSLWSPAAGVADQYVQLQRRRSQEPATATNSATQPRGRLSQMLLARQTALFSPPASPMAQDDLPTPHDMFGPIQAYRNETTALPLPAQLFLLQPAMLQRTPFAKASAAPDQRVDPLRSTLRSAAFLASSPAAPLPLLQRNSLWSPAALDTPDQRVQLQRRHSEQPATANQPALRHAAILASSPAAPLPLLQRNSLWSPAAGVADQYVQLQRRRSEQPAPLATDSTIQPRGRLSHPALERETALFSPTALSRAQDDLPTSQAMFAPTQPYRNETTALPLLTRLFLAQPAMLQRTPFTKASAAPDQRVDPLRSTLRSAALLASSPAAPLPLLQRAGRWIRAAGAAPDQWAQLQRRRSEQPAPLATDSTIQPRGRLSHPALERETALFSPTALRRAQDDLPTPQNVFAPTQTYRNTTTALPLPAQLFLLQPAMLQRNSLWMPAIPSNQPVLRQRHSLEQPILSFVHRAPGLTVAVQRSSWGNRTADATPDQRVDPVRPTLRSAAILASSSAAPLPLLQRSSLWSAAAGAGAAQQVQLQRRRSQEPAPLATDSAIQPRGRLSHPALERETALFSPTALRRAQDDLPTPQNVFAPTQTYRNTTTALPLLAQPFLTQSVMLQRTSFAAANQPVLRQRHSLEQPMLSFIHRAPGLAGAAQRSSWRNRAAEAAPDQWVQLQRRRSEEPAPLATDSAIQPRARLSYPALERETALFSPTALSRAQDDLPTAVAFAGPTLSILVARKLNGRVSAIHFNQVQSKPAAVDRFEAPESIQHLSVELAAPLIINRASTAANQAHGERAWSQPPGSQPGRQAHSKLSEPAVLPLIAPAAPAIQRFSDNVEISQARPTVTSSVASTETAISAEQLQWLARQIYTRLRRRILIDLERLHQR